MSATRSMNSCSALLAITAVGAVSVSIGMWIRTRKIQAYCRRLRQQLDDTRLQQEDPALAERKQTRAAHVSSRPTLETQIATEGLLVRPIGTIRSIYRLCVGTPRQGLLVPNARGRIELAKLGDASISSSVFGLEGYSHVWILFVFHLNTKSKKSNRIKTKITPPALGGEKIGILATRSPHRFNPIGITLSKLDRIEIDNNQNVTLLVSGLDLVDGTPVLDIKPYVPVYDSVEEEEVRLPPWVSGGLATKREVEVSAQARTELTEMLATNGNVLQFYGPHMGELTTSETVEAVLDCVRQVLAIDVRSGYQTEKARRGKSQAERSHRVVHTNATTEEEELNDEGSTQQLDNLLIKFKIVTSMISKRSESKNSGAEDKVIVTSIQLLERKN